MVTDVLLRIGKVALAHYESDAFNPREVQFNLWLASLSPAARKEMSEQGMEWCKRVLSFQRFSFKPFDHSMDECMKTNLSQEDYDFWRQMAAQ